MALRARAWVCPEDKDFLSDWATELNEKTRKPVSTAHIMAVLVSQLRTLRAQGKLFPTLSEIEAQAVRLAHEEYEADRVLIDRHAREWRASAALAEERQQERGAKQLKMRRAA